MNGPLVLIILDGWGIGRKDESNPIHFADPKNIFFLEENFPAGALQASGVAVGIPWDEEGNSEIGHLTIGAGRVLFQHYKEISSAIKNGSFFDNKILKGAFEHAKKANSSIHIAGLIGDGIVHSSITHLLALLEMAKKNGCDKKVFLHLFTDGRDSAPDLAGIMLKKIGDTGIGKIASISGRYYAMDRDKHWDRTKRTYDTMVSPENAERKTVENIIKDAREKRLSDEFIVPTAIQGGAPVSENDSLIFFNFREDRMRQISRLFLKSDVPEIQTKKFESLYIATMTEYEYVDEKYSACAAFRRDAVKLPVGEVISNAGKSQLRIAETEKYAHITYFFNGFREKPYPNEFRVLIPSKNVEHYEDNPEMMASAITERAILALKEKKFDFILINYANTDIIAHTGNYDATIKAVKKIDEEIGKLARVALNEDAVLFITSDHGNAECVLNIQTGEPETKHNASPVPLYLVGKKFALSSKKAPYSRLQPIGFLSDVAPTILEIMGIEKPREMTGQSLLKQLLGE